MRERLLVVARVYDKNNNLIGCGVFNSNKLRVECMNLKQVVKLIQSNRVDNVVIRGDKITGKHYGDLEFSRLPSVVYVGGNDVVVKDARLYVLDFSDEYYYPCILPNGGYQTFI